MNIKLQFMKLMAKRGRRKLLKRLATFSIKGEKFMVPRTDAAPVMTYLHRPTCGGENLPVVFNVHGRRKPARGIQCPRRCLGGR